MSCTTRILNSNDNGYITQCTSCGVLHIAYGTILLQVDDLEFTQFTNFISREIGRYEDYEFPTEKTFIYSTDSRKIKMIFTLTELREINELLVQAHLMKEVLRITQ